MWKDTQPQRGIWAESPLRHSLRGLFWWGNFLWGSCCGVCERGLVLVTTGVLPLKSPWLIEHTESGQGNHLSLSPLLCLTLLPYLFSLLAAQKSSIHGEIL